MRILEKGDFTSKIDDRYLKRKDDMIYEGQTVVQSEIVSICTLKACNVYTEVFRFKTYKDRSQLV